MGAAGSGGTRSEDYGTDVERARRSPNRAWGDKPELLVARLDEDGKPEGNRQERRMAERMLRRRK